MIGKSKAYQKALFNLSLLNLQMLIKATGTQKTGEENVITES
jgi:hypothetical protein